MAPLPRGVSAFDMLPAPLLVPDPARPIDINELARSIPPEVPPLAVTSAQVEAIAWDITLMPERRDEVCAFYGISTAQWGVLIESPAYLASQRHAREALKSDPNLAARLTARSAMSEAVGVAAELARSRFVEPRDRLRAVELLARFVAMEDTGAGAESRKARAGAGTGAVVTLNFGSAVGQVLKQVIVERDE